MRYGILLTDDPIAGEKVIIQADGWPPLEAHLSTVEMGVRRPKIGILLRHMGQDDVPIGARIRSVDQ